MDHKSKLKLDGLTILEGAFSSSQCKYFIEKLQKIVEFNRRTISYTQGQNTTFTPNFFRHDLDLLALVNIPAVDEILTDLIDEDYVLVACNAINRTKSEDNKAAIDVGQNWHTDSPYVGGRRMEAGIFYSVLIMLDEFTSENGTAFIPNSHLRTDRPNRDETYPEIMITGKPGDIVIFDSGLWHKGGVSTEANRWGVFNLYGPWFIKPYFNFPKMFDFDSSNLDPVSARLLHFNSTPPNDETERFATLVK